MSSGANGKGYESPRLAPRYSSLRDLSVTYEGHSEDVATRPPDISTRGMFINTNRDFPEGAVLNVQFRLALSGVAVRSRCEVRYCLAGVGVGVEFVEISSEAVRAIEKEIELANGQQARKKSKSTAPK
ncbi:MAG: PilZ domain-containing protein [Candidatus Acidiferrales bacterium]